MPDGASAAGAGPVIQTTCPYCGVGCGVDVDLGVSPPRVSGSSDHPANHGRLCSKGAALGETLELEDRLLYPEVRGERVSWDHALDTVASGVREVIDRHGPDAVAFYVSGQILTEDYYVANKLMKGFIGSGNIDTNSRLCMSTSVAGHKRAFGSDTVPGCYEDLELADLVVLVGSNLAWAHPVLYQRLAAVKRRRGDVKVVVVDPRRTATCEIADLHLPLKPGTDAVLFNGLLNHLRREDVLDWGFLEAHTEGFAAAMQSARDTAGSIPAVAAACELPERDIAELYSWFARSERSVTVYSQGINQSSSGVDKVNAIINVHLATGRIGRPGMGPFSVTGQPNAMGGREVGGLANQLAAHMDLEQPEDLARVAGFWGSERIARRPGLKAVELFEAVRQGRVKALWIVATNPVVSLPEADRVREALKACELVVVSDCMRHTDTTPWADVLLPAATWGEKDGTVTNSERRISRQRRFRSAPGEARPDWWIMTQVARRMGFESAFPYEGPDEIFREHARLSALDNAGTRDFDIGGLAGLSGEAYDRLTPVQWPVTESAPGGTRRLFAEGAFYTPSGKARLIPVTPRPPENSVDDDYPLVLNTGRIRDQWHTMTRTGRVARLTGHMPEPFVQIHPDDAAVANLRDGDLARVMSRAGALIARVMVSSDQRPGSVFVPMHWSGQFASAARVGALVASITDPISGQPESKHTPVRIEPFGAWHAFVLSRRRLSGLRTDYLVSIRGEGFWRYELADRKAFRDWGEWAREQLGDEGDWLEFADRGAGRYRVAKVVNGRLDAVVFVASGNELPERSWLGRLFELTALDEAARASLLTGRPAKGEAVAGRIVCSCLGVGLNTILNAIKTEGLGSVEAVGEVLGAGTNCGSCLPELKAVLESLKGRVAA